MTEEGPERGGKPGQYRSPTAKAGRPFWGREACLQLPEAVGKRCFTGELGTETRMWRGKEIVKSSIEILT